MPGKIWAIGGLDGILMAVYVGTLSVISNKKRRKNAIKNKGQECGMRTSSLTTVSAGDVSCTNTGPGFAIIIKCWDPCCVQLATRLLAASCWCLTGAPVHPRVRFAFAVYINKWFIDAIYTLTCGDAFSLSHSFSSLECYTDARAVLTLVPTRRRPCSHHPFSHARPHVRSLAPARIDQNDSPSETHT